MKKDEIIAMLQKQNSFLQEQLQEANHKMDALLEEVSSLRNLLEQKSEEEAKQKRIVKGLAKITQNKSEKQPTRPTSQDTATDQPSEKKERAKTNNGAKRKQHLEVEVVEEDGKLKSLSIVSPLNEMLILFNEIIDCFNFIFFCIFTAFII